MRCYSPQKSGDNKRTIQHAVCVSLIYGGYTRAELHVVFSVAKLVALHCAVSAVMVATLTEFLLDALVRRIGIHLV